MSLVLALAGSHDELVDRICEPMPRRTAKAFRRQLSRLGPTRLSDVEAAQRLVAAAAARRIAEQKTTSYILGRLARQTSIRSWPRSSVKTAQANRGPDSAVQPIAFSFADMRGQANNYLERRPRGGREDRAGGPSPRRSRFVAQAEVAGRKAAEAAVERILDEKVARRMDTLFPALEQLVAQVNDAKGELLGHWQRSAVRVATAIAERIIRRELRREPQITLDLVEEALRLAAGTAEITLHMNADRLRTPGPAGRAAGRRRCRQLAPSQHRRRPRGHASAVAASKRVSAKSTCRSNRSSAALKKSLS